MKNDEKNLPTIQLRNGRVVLNRYSVKTLTFNIVFQRNDLVYLRPYIETTRKTS